MSGHAWAEVAGAVGIFALITVVSSVTIVQVATTLRARAALAREAEYRRLAETSTETGAATERRLAALDEHLADLRTRLGSIERTLRQVE